MGQKVNPHGLRVGVIKDWDSKWYADADFSDNLVEDYNIRKFIKKRLYSAGISKIEIERASDRVKIYIYTAKPGVVIGKGGADIEKLKADVQKLTDKKLVVDIKEVKRPDNDAQLVAENIAQQLENRISFRRAMKRSVQSAMRQGAEGVRINCGGRLGGGQAYQICPSKAEKYAKANFAEIKKRLPQLSGPYFVDVMSIIAMRKCDHPSHPITRRENCQYYRSILHLTQENFGLSMSEGSRDWAIDRLDRAFLIFGKTKNTLAFCDEHIPFFQMVYHGIILYNNGRCHVNAMAGSVGYLENIRWGGLPLVYFHHLFNPEWVGAAGWANDLRFDSPEKLAKDVAVIKQMSNDAQALRSTQQAFLDDYIDYNENLSETVYSNGVHVWVNRGGKAEKTSDGRSVAPYSFLIQ